MSKSITVMDKDYSTWIHELKQRYRRSQIKAAVGVNQEMLRFYWDLGHDIVEMHIEERWGQGVLSRMSIDLKREMPLAEGLSVTNLRYCRRFYLLYSQATAIRPQVEGKLNEDIIHPQVEGEMVPQLFLVPWGHHKMIMDKVGGDAHKAMFFIKKTIENGWSRAMLLNWLDTGLYEREGKAQSNFTATLPAADSGLAQEMTKDPYNFAFAGVRGVYNETLLKNALLTNITDFLIELGTGFAYVGREYRLQIGETENFIDLLFYHLELRCYVVVEVKIDKFSPKDIGQLSTYVVACNHLVKRDDDNPTIGLLICKSKDNTMAQYALEGTTQPIGISEYELEKLYPKKVEGAIPTIEEIESKLNE